MLTLTHFVVVSAHKLVPMLDDAVIYMQQFTKVGPDQRNYISFVTGPGRTADIERTLAIGVQGPKALNYYLEARAAFSRVDGRVPDEIVGRATTRVYLSPRQGPPTFPAE